MEIPSQLLTIIASLSPEESEEMRRFLDDLPAHDMEITALISENLESLVQVLAEDYSETLVRGIG
ncbi:MAG: hypothetical protein VKL39_03455 [Leptolyngbyaceae bacterium]|nr:hypothetical protein [Leptolyngbyaceae bacterium]